MRCHQKMSNSSLLILSYYYTCFCFLIMYVFVYLNVHYLLSMSECSVLVFFLQCPSQRFKTCILFKTLNNTKLKKNSPFSTFLFDLLVLILLLGLPVFLFTSSICRHLANISIKKKSSFLFDWWSGCSFKTRGNGQKNQWFRWPLLEPVCVYICSFLL